MRMNKIVRVLPLMPMVSIKTQLSKKRSSAENFEEIKKWSQSALKWMGFSLKSKGEGYTQNMHNTLLVCNHQGTLDPALITATCLSPVAFISKKENESIPILGQMSANLGTIHFDRDSREGNISMLRSSIKRLKNGGNLLIFPEGTRSLSDTMNDFKRGALKPAYMAKSTILPVVIHQAYCLDVKKSTDSLQIEYLQPMPYEEYAHLKEDELSRLLHEKIQQHVYAY